MTEIQKEKLVNMISVSSLASLSFSRSLWKRIEQSLEILSNSFTGSQLAEITTKAIFNKHYYLFPRDFLYMKALLKWFASFWESREWPGSEIFTVPDELKEAASEIVYKTYLRSDGLLQVTLLEAVQGITGGTTGLSSWGAGNVLADWCIANSHMLAGRKVLELGAGIGQTACTLLSFMESKDMPLSYLATDCHPHVLSILHHNLTLLIEDTPTKTSLEEFHLKMNRRIESEEIPAGEVVPWKPEEDFDAKGTQIRVRQLDWRQPPEEILDTSDVVLAADVVYARNLLPFLAGILKRALTPPVKKTTSESSHRENTSENTNYENMEDQGKIAYVACTRRSRETISEFLRQISINDMSYEQIYQASLDREGALFGYDESHLPVIIYKITRNSICSG